MTVLRTARSLLYVPGDRPDWLVKARAARPDGVILDLEDSVAPERRAAARTTVRRMLADRGDADPELWVRVDSRSLAEDVAAAASPALTGIVLAKADARSLADVDRALGQEEERKGLAHATVPVIAIVETAEALGDLGSVASAPRVVRMALGEADLAAELGITADDDRTELYPARFELVVASAAAGLQRPLGPVHTRLQDLEGLSRTSSRLRRQGYRGRTAVHPGQVAVITEAFTPTPDEVAAARDAVAVHDRALEEGSGATRSADGLLLDPATVRGARELLDLLRE